VSDISHRRLAGLDVLRGWLCLAVFAVHSLPSRWAETGWLAMPVFFVLSGFVITRSLLAAEQQGLPVGTQLRRFFARRALRILPTLLVFLVITVPLARWVGHGSEAGWPYALLFIHNFWVMSAAHEMSYFYNHLWSLSVEEQFYLVFPWLFIGCRKHRVALLMVALLLAPLARELLSELAQQYPQAFTSQRARGAGATPRDLVVYVFGLSHVDAFAIGALLALRAAGAVTAIARWRWLLLATVSVFGMGGLITGQLDGLSYRPFLGRAGQAQEVWGYSLLNIWAVVLVAVFALRPASGLSARPLAWLGRISFEFYLMHYPVIALCAFVFRPGSTLPAAAWVALPLLATLAAALLLNRTVTWLTRPLQQRLDAKAVDAGIASRAPVINGAAQ